MMTEEKANQLKDRASNLLRGGRDNEAQYAAIYEELRKAGHAQPLRKKYRSR